MVLILAHAADAGAASVAERLSARIGRTRVRTLRPEALALARWSHRVDVRGGASTRLTPPDGRTVASGEIEAVLNRIRYLPLPRFRRASPKDVDYAGAELQAVVASWLCELGDRVVNPVGRHPWLTPEMPLPLWASIASAAGLPVRSARLAASANGADERDCAAGTWPHASDEAVSRVLVAGDAVTGEMAPRYGATCIAAARAMSVSLVEFVFVLAGPASDIALVHVDLLPPLLDAAQVELTANLLNPMCGCRSQP